MTIGGGRVAGRAGCGDRVAAGSTRLRCGALLALLLLGCDPRDETPALRPDRPLSVVLITLDTVRADALGVYGQSRPTTPRLDRLAREGVVFEQAMTAAPHTLAAHASLFTGLYPFAHGARANHGYALAESNVTLAERLAAAGYRTRAEIAAPVLRAATRIAQGFEDAPPPPAPARDGGETPAADLPGGGLRRAAENVTRRGLEFIEDVGDAPYLLWLHYFDAHLPYVDRPADRARFPDAPYLAQVAALDREVGRLVDAIERRGARDRTLVVVTSDHGEGLGEHGEPTHSYFVYESTMRVPLVFWGADALARGRRLDTLARTVDVMPTLLEALSLPPQPALHGRSLWPLLAADAPADATIEPAPAYGESLDLQRIFGTTPLRALRDGRWKYIHSARPELYDLARDPAERVDLAAAHPERVASFRSALEALLDPAAGAARHRAAAPLSAATRAQLEALGYVAPAGTPRDADDERATLAPAGPPPATLAADAERLARAKGSIAARRPERALALLEPVLRAHPQSATVHALEAEALAIAGRLDEALAGFARALALDADPCSEVRLDLARALARAGREAQRIEVLEAGLAACPSVATYRNELAWALATTPAAAHRDGASAVEIARPLLEAGGAPDPNHLDTLAAAYAASARWDEALATQRRAIRRLEHAGADAKRLAAYRRTADRYARAAADAARSAP